MEQYTKGEWKWEWEQGQPTIRKKDGLDLIAIVYPKIGKRLFAPIDEAEANAHLISASPRMYEWLKELGLHMAVNYDDDMKPIFTIDNDYLDKRKDILAKAENKS